MKKLTSVSIISAIALVFLIPSSMPVFATPYLGDISFVGFNFAPNGYAFCNGQLLPINDDTSPLFNLIGTTYGGDGQTTFALPDMRGRAPIGFGQGPGLSNYVIGQTGGAETHTLTISEMPAHSHALMASGAQANTNDPAGHVLARAWPQLYSTTTNNLVAMNPSSIGSIGGNQPFNMMQPYLAVNCIIVVEGGIFPSQN